MLHRSLQTDFAPAGYLAAHALRRYQTPGRIKLSWLIFKGVLFEVFGREEA